MIALFYGPFDVGGCALPLGFHEILSDRVCAFGPIQSVPVAILVGFQVCAVDKSAGGIIPAGVDDVVG